MANFNNIDFVMTAHDDFCSQSFPSIYIHSNFIFPFRSYPNKKGG